LFPMIILMVPLFPICGTSAHPTSSLKKYVFSSSASCFGPKCS
jgi:hypothetical protein